MIDYDKKENAKRLREGLKNHVVFVAEKGRSKYQEITSLETVQQILNDPDIVRFPATFEFCDKNLNSSQFVSLNSVEDNPTEKFVISLHPLLQNRIEDSVKAVLYTIVNINYGKIAKEYEAELFVSLFLGIKADDYHVWTEALKEELA